jgi:exodeoxyribonuclease-3
MRIATWNINGVKARIDSLLRWLREASPDVVCLQEIKTVDEGFPAAALEDLGYNVAVHGQKGFHGVALLSKRPMEDIRKGLPPTSEDVQSRFISALIDADGGVVRVASAYMPNGNPIGEEKFAYKLAWLRRLENWAREELTREEPLVIAGELQHHPHPARCEKPGILGEPMLFTPRKRGGGLSPSSALGLTDAIARSSPPAGSTRFGTTRRAHGSAITHPQRPPPALA